MPRPEGNCAAPSDGSPIYDDASAQAAAQLLQMDALLTHGSSDQNKNGFFEREELQSISQDPTMNDYQREGATLLLEHFDDVRQFASAGSLNGMAPKLMKDVEKSNDSEQGISSLDLFAAGLALAPEFLTSAAICRLPGNTDQLQAEVRATRNTINSWNLP